MAVQPADSSVPLQAVDSLRDHTLPPESWPVGRLMSAVNRRVEREWNTWLANWGLNHASLPVLYLLGSGPLSQRELAASMEVTEQTMSRILVRLERLGYVQRRTHDLDRRRHEVLLTESGRTALAEAGDPQNAEAMTVRGLSDRQVENLRTILLTMLAQNASWPDPHDAGNIEGSCHDD